jgi:hypothetical protein
LNPDLLSLGFWRRLLPAAHANLVFVLKLGGEMKPIVPIPADYRVVFPADPAVFGSGMSDVHLSPVLLAARVECGDLLGVITHRDQVVHRALVQTRGPAQLEGYRRGFSLQTSQAFIHSCETAGDHRGHSLYPHMLGCILSWLKDAHYKEAWISCVRSNAASIRGIEKAGFDFYASATVIAAGWERIAWIRWDFDRKVFERHGACSVA